MNTKHFLMKFDKSASPTLDLNKLKRNPDGSAVFNAIHMRGGDFPYMPYEIGYDMVNQIRQRVALNNKGDDSLPDYLIGNISTKEVKKSAKQLEGIPLTDGHIFVTAKNKDNTVVGRVLENGSVDKDGHVHARTVITDSGTLTSVESGTQTELSIGFSAAVELNDKAGIEGEPHFFVNGIELNHVAVVREGRAGPRARLMHSMGEGHTLLQHGQINFKDDKTMKEIIISKMTFSVDDSVAEAINAERLEAQEAQKTLKSDFEANKLALAKLKGEYSAVEAKLAAQGNVEDTAKALLLEHNSLCEKLNALGITEKPTVGDYDAQDVLSKALIKHGIPDVEGCSLGELNAMAMGVMHASQGKQGSGALEEQHNDPVKMGYAASDNGANHVMGAVNNKLFKGNK